MLAFDKCTQGRIMKDSLRKVSPRRDLTTKDALDAYALAESRIS